MRSFGQFLGAPLVVWLVLTQGCALIPEDMPKKGPPVGLIATPPSYYSTLKAKYLGQKYQENLSRLVEKIVRNPKTANLQFANNIASVGGIGFFTHSVAKVPDERYLEVVLMAPETFERKGDYSAKVHRLFSLYGSELLTILSSDVDIYREPEVGGYGLNLSWRTITSEASGPSVALERAVAYFPKEEVRRFLKKEVVENNFLRDAVIFAAEADGPMNLVSYRQQERQPDFRPPIQEEILAVGQTKPHAESKPSEVPAPKPEAEKEAENQGEPSAIVEKRANAETDVPRVTQTSEESPRDLSHKAEMIGVKASAPAAQSPRSEPETAPDKTPVEQQAIVQKPSPPVIETSQPAEVKSSPPVQPPGLAKHETPLAPSPASESSRESKATETRLQPPVIAKAQKTSVGQATTKETQGSEDLSLALSKKAKVPEPEGDPRVLETGQPPPAAADKSPLKASSPGMDSPLSAKIPAPLEEKVDAPVAASKPEVKSTEERSQPALAAPPKVLPPVSPSLATSRPAKAGERLSPPQTPPKEDYSIASTEARIETTNEKKPYAVPSVAPDRAAPVVQTQEIERPKLEKSVGPEVAVPAGAKMAPPRTSTETQAVMKLTPEAPAPVVGVKGAIAGKIVPLQAAPVATPAKQAVAEPVTEEIALLTNKPRPNPAEGPSGVRVAPKTLKGYIIQVAFTDTEMAQHWAERLERRGFAVSVTKAGSSGSIRVRIGNFPVRQEAERELRSLGKDGLSGIVLNLPDGFRPTEGAAATDPNVTAVPAAQ